MPTDETAQGTIAVSPARGTTGLTEAVGTVQVVASGILRRLTICGLGPGRLRLAVEFFLCLALGL